MSSPLAHLLLVLSVVVTAACGDSGALGTAAPTTPVPVPTPAPAPTPAPKPRETVIQSDLVTESSGLARSQRDPKVLWTHNDSGGNAEGFALDTDGKLLGTLTLQGGMTAGAPASALAIDWEDMASFTRDGQPFLLFADIGDNSAVRPFLTFYVVAEPDIAALAKPFAITVTPTQVITASYPDGPRDAESVAVDGTTNTVYVLSKRDAQPMLYSGALGESVTAPTGAVVLTNLGPIRIPRAPAGTANPESINWTTSMDFSQALDQALVLTLTKAYRYPRKAGESWFAAMSRAPEAIVTPQYSQSEALTFALDGRSFFMSSENAPYPLAEIPLP